MSTWSRLIRFVDEEGKTSFGEPDIDNIEQLESRLQDGSLYAHELVGQDPFSLTAGSRRLRVKELLPILTPEDVPIIRCIGLNYMKHSAYTS
jgi:hypothetical protein